MSTPHPWRALRSLAHVRLHWRDDMPPHLRGATDGQRIWMRADLSQVERRCTLAHELEHVRAGHRDCQPEVVERQVRARAARFLLPDVHVVADALAWAHDVEEAADVLWVTPRVLAHRLEALHPAERAIIAARLSQLEEGA